MKKTKRELHDNLHSPQIECEECGGDAQIVDTSYPNAYECKCKKCGHKFTWTESKYGEAED